MKEENSVLTTIYMPEFENMTVKDGNGNVRPAQNKITVRELFTMTAGFGYDVGSPMLRQCLKDTDGECPTLTVMEYLAKEPLLFEPGYRWNYSLCHDVLAALVEKISGMTFGEYVKRNIFDVCDMENSSFLIDESNAERLVCHYSYNNRTGKVEKCPKNVHFRIGTKYESGGAGCVSCVDDYIKFLEALRTYKLLKKETVDLLSTNQMTKEQMDMPSYWVALKRGYGLGQQCPTKTNKRPDFGWGGAAGSHYFVDCRDGITAFFATQVEPFFVKSPYLFKKYYRISRKSVLVCIHFNVGRKLAFADAAGYGSRDHRRAVLVAYVVLNYENGTYAALFRAYYRT